MSRADARQTAMRFLFEYEFNPVPDDDMDALELMQPVDLNDDDRQYIDTVRAGVLDNLAEINAVIAKYSVGWELERMAKVDMAILRVAVYELLHTRIPGAVSIKEAVSMAQMYSSDESAPFINGILGSFIRDLQSEGGDQADRSERTK